MYDTKECEIDLGEAQNSKELIDTVISTIDNDDYKNADIRLKLHDAYMSESQMVFIKSLIESYGHKLSFVQSNNDETKSMLASLGILTNGSLEHADDINNFELDELREQFKTELNKQEENAETIENIIEELPDNPNQKAVEVIKDSDEQKQVIGIYKKAYEEDNKDTQEDEIVDFYTTPTDEPVVADTNKTMYINQTVRSGQTIDFDGNVVIIGDCHPGSEIKAAGDITVWGVLGSIAHAGKLGNEEAKIRALKINAVQLRIANCYSRRPDGSNIPYIVKSSTFQPEEARLVDNNIVLYKMTSK